MKISVVLAAYNGEKYICEQLSSVLSQLGENDEVIVSDDNPAGKTKEAVLSLGDSRIIYTEGEGKGVVKNFENALRKASGDVIFLCDQDDVWLPGKVDTVIAAVQSGCDLVLHDASVTDENLNITDESYFRTHGSNGSFVKNIIKNSFVGCCMAFTRPVLECALPFPPNVPMHDWWIALAAMKNGYRVKLIDTPLILWRRHGDNVTGGKTSLASKIRWRADIIASLARAGRRKDK